MNNRRTITVMAAPVAPAPNLGYMDALDVALKRAHEIFLEDESDESEAELKQLMPALLQAGYVEENEWGDGWLLWGFTDAGIKRGEELGCL